MTTLPKRPTIKELYNTMLNDYQVRSGGKFVLLKKAVIKCTFWAISGCLSMLWRFLSWVYRQIFPQTCGKNMIILWGALVDVEYQYGQSTILQVKAEDVTAPRILSGAVYKHLKTGNIYKSVSTITPQDGIAEFTVTASKGGSAYNLDKGEVLQITNPIEGVPSTVTVTDIITYGSEDEDIEKYRPKVLLRFKKRPQGGSFQDYVDWCKEVPGIADALPYCLNAGIVTIYLVGEGSGKNRTPAGTVIPNPFPEWENGQMKNLSGSGIFLKAAQSINGTAENLNTRRPVNAKVELKAPNYAGIKVKIQGLKPLDDDIKANIKTVLTEYLDTKRPHIIAIGYTEDDAVINANEMNGGCQTVLNKRGSYTSFEVSNTNDEKIDTLTLGIGELAYLEKLSINGVDVEINDN